MGVGILCERYHIRPATDRKHWLGVPMLVTKNVCNLKNVKTNEYFKNEILSRYPRDLLYGDLYPVPLICSP